MKSGWKKGGPEVQGGLKYLPSASFSKCVCTLKPLRRMLNCMCAKKPQKKTPLFSAEQAYKYLHSCPHYLSNGRWEQRQGQGQVEKRPARFRHPSVFVWKRLEVPAPPPPPLAEWAGLSRTCAPVGFRLPRPGLSVHLGFCLCFPLEESCWYEVSHSLTLKSRGASPSMRK